MSELNQIEEIKKLYGKTKGYKIPKTPKEGQTQVSIRVEPLGLDELTCMDMKKDAPMNEVVKNVKILFSKSLGISEEEAGKISFEYMEEMITAIMDANNFKEEDIERTGIKSFLAKKREQANNNESDKPVEE